MSKSSIIQIGIIIMILFVGYFTYSYLNKERMEDLDLNTKLKKLKSLIRKMMKNQKFKHLILFWNYLINPVTIEEMSMK